MTLITEAQRSAFQQLESHITDIHLHAQALRALGDLAMAEGCMPHAPLAHVLSEVRTEDFACLMRIFSNAFIQSADLADAKLGELR